MSEDFPAQLTGFQVGSLLAGYRLESEVGAGGMAVVFRARDERLARLVALKILAPALASVPGFRQRFISESRAAAVVDNPHIIPVYEAGEADGVLYIAMRFVGGGDLRQVLDREGPLAPDRAVDFVSQVASALDAAHRVGLAHRDVKPANVLVDTSADRPDHAYLSDFGISKEVTASAGLTRPGQYLGTALYSAPEQIRGLAVDGRTDQYALACVAYQLLTGVVPFERDQVPALMYAHLSEPPPSLRPRRPDLPGAADEVLARAMAKVPEKRYGTCQEFADALRAALDPSDTGGSAATRAGSRPDQRELPDPRTFRDTEPVAPHRRHSIPVTIKAWTPRRRLATLVLGCVVLAAAGVIPFVLTNLAQSPRPKTSPSPANSGIPAITLSYSRAGIDLGSPYTGNAVASLAFSPSGTTLAIADDYLCLWGIAAAGCTTDSSFTLANSVAFDAGGTILAVGNAAGRTVLWDVATRKLAATVTNPGSKGVGSVAFSPDGKLLAVGDFNGRTYLWDVATGHLAATLADPGSKGVASVRFSRDGKTVAAGDFNGPTNRWDVAAGHLATALADPGGKGVDAVAFSPDGKILATADSDGSTYLWNAATGKLTGSFPDPSFKGVLSVAFSPDGKLLAAGDGDGSTYLWNVATAEVAATLADPGSINVASVAFSPDGKTLATGDYSGSVNLWHES